MIRYSFLRFPQGKFKAVTFSYDDGCKQDLRFSEILTRYGMKGTFNLNSDEMRKGRGLSTEEVKEHLLAKGHEIAVHGYNHRALGLQRPIEGIKDVLDCRLELEEKYGILVRGMAYPDSGITRFANGTDYETVKRYLTDLGIVYSRSLGGDNRRFFLPTDWHNWVPSVHHSNPECMEYAREFVELSERSNAGGAPRLFYVWGHSYEFDDNDNWELAETLCATLAHKEDTWYPTNMELYEYVKAYEALIYSADGKLVYNPTLQTIWLWVNSKEYTVAPGETLDLHPFH